MRMRGIFIRILVPFTFLFVLAPFFSAGAQELNVEATGAVTGRHNNFV